MLTDPGSWFAFLTLTALEVILGIDNVLMLSIVVARLPPERQGLARGLGLGLATATRIALLLSVVALTRLTTPWFSVGLHGVSGRDLVLLAGGLFLMGKSVAEIRRTLLDARAGPAPRAQARLFFIVLQIAALDVVFSIDSVFTAVGVARPDQLPLMIAAILTAIVAMMFVSAGVGRFLERRPRLKILALSFLVLVGASLIAAAFQFELPREDLYVALAFGAAVEALNFRLRR
jgi:predicted tellurium resistance membrane protein TerC